MGEDSDFIQTSLAKAEGIVSALQEGPPLTLADMQAQLLALAQLVRDAIQFIGEQIP